MLSPYTITQTYHRQEKLHTIHLAPFGLEELESVFPVDKETLGYHQAGVDEAFQSPARLLEDETYLPESLCWGMYQTAIAPPNFVGMLNLNIDSISDDTEPWDQPRVNQYISVTIMSRVYQGRGLGSAAIRAAVTYAFTHQDTLEVAAFIHPNNIASASAFRKTGFRHLGDHSAPVSFVNGDVEVLNEWLLTRPGQLGLYEPGSPEIGILEEGYAQYLQSLEQTTFTVSNLGAN